MGQSFGRASGTTVEELKNQINIVDVVGRVVPLKRAGANYKGVCPFHSEKTPSFVVSEQKQIFTCFGCGASGDVIEFTKRYYNLDFAEAVEKLAKEVVCNKKDTEEEMYFKRTEYMTRVLLQKFPEMNESLREKIIDDKYGEMYENNNH